jgi:hypothetical protein
MQTFETRQRDVVEGASPCVDAISSLGPIPDEIMTLAEAATRIGISRRRAQDLIATGQLPARRHRNAWLVSAKAVLFANRVLRHAAGHPLSERGAWELISHQLESCSADPSEHDYLRRRVRDRARHSFAIVHPASLRALRRDRRVVLSGRDAAAAHGAPVDPGNPLDAYVRVSDVASLRAQYQCDDSFENANLYLHAVDDDAWPFKEGCRFVSVAVAWLDLADQGDPVAQLLVDRLAVGRATN